ncbi:MAG: NUDIX hydrolase [Magnetospirillum sp.]|nr:NUDIX hydrolase [Magnetospirillum sp.]
MTQAPPASRDYPTHPLPAVIAMVARKGRVLLVRRGKGTAPDPWGFPGGLVEVGETVAEAAVRELAEETGVTAEAGPVAEVLDIIQCDKDGRVRTHFILNAVPCRWLAGEPAAASDAIEAGWFTLDQIAAMTCHPNLPRLAKAILAQAILAG